DEVGLRPQIWCPRCRDDKHMPPDGGGRFKACGLKKDADGSFGVDHVRVKCRLCGQKITQAHGHLSYVGHAHATSRLLEADPQWTWRPMGRDVPDEVMIAAIGTGSPEVIAAVAAAYPPKIIEMDIGNGRVERVMWGELVIHDGDGNEIVTPGVGDAIGKAWGPNALKEIIGDLVRNAAMRRGLALNLWMKQDADQAARESRVTAGADDPAGSAARAALFDDDAGPAKGRGRTAGPKPGTASGEAGINPEAQAAADMAWLIAQDPAKGGLDALQACHGKARDKRLLGLHCLDPRHADS